MGDKVDKISLRHIEFLVFIVATIFAAYFYLEANHADQLEFREQQITTKIADLELQSTVLQHEINRDNFARRRYESIIKGGEASESDFVRYEYLKLQIENIVKEKEKVDNLLALQQANLSKLEANQ